MEPGQEIFPETGLENYGGQEEEFPENAWDLEEVDNYEGEESLSPFLLF